MPKLPFRLHHTLEILKGYEQSPSAPLDFFLHNYFRHHKALGPKDRMEIAEKVYIFIRWKGLIDHLVGPSASWTARLELLNTFSPQDYLHRQDLIPHLQVSFPKGLFSLIEASFGTTLAREIGWICNEPAPTTLRVNLLKSSREHLTSIWPEGSCLKPCPFAPAGLHVLGKAHFYSQPAFREGYFEVQDEGSQLVADLIEAKPGQLVLDYCAGAGGKALAFAPKMQGRGQIFLHDIRPKALQEAKRRLARAGIENAQTVLEGSKALSSMKQKFHWVLVDAPCTGTGTLRRNPDLKWRFSDTLLLNAQEEQRKIFAKALEYLRPDGKIVYATCSLLREENQDAVRYFETHLPVRLVGTPFQTLPLSGGMDGFFAACFVRSTPSKAP